MKRAWPLVVVALALLACWDFEGEYQRCLDTGRCSTGGGGDGGSDGGDGGGGGCPSGAPTGNGLCLVARYSTLADTHGIFGTSSSSILVGGANDSFEWIQSGVLTVENTGLGNYVTLTDLHGLSDSDVWSSGTAGFVGHSYVYHWDGSNWTNEFPSTTTGVDDCNGIWEEAAGAAFAACDLAVIRVTTAAQVQTILDSSATGLTYHGIWGVPGGPAWTVGSNLTTGEGIVSQRNGSTWSTQTFTTGVLRAIHGRNDHDVWAVGDTAALLHLDDAGWHPVSAGVTADFNDVFVAPSGQAWVTTYDQRVLVIEPDGGRRAFIPPGLLGVPEYLVLQRVHVFSTGDVWLTASTDDGGTNLQGAILHYRQQ